MDNSDEDDLLQSPDQKRSAKWWETAEDHRFALEVLQLRARREILKLISFEARSLDEIEKRNYGNAAQRLANTIRIIEEGGITIHATATTKSKKVESDGNNEEE